MRPEYDEDYNQEDDSDIDDGMPCVCNCGHVFDLHDGYASSKSNITLCEDCHRKEEIAEEILTLEEQNQDLESDLKFNRNRIEELKKQLS
jgi:hypothetical protein